MRKRGKDTDNDMRYSSVDLRHNVEKCADEERMW